MKRLERAGIENPCAAALLREARERIRTAPLPPFFDAAANSMLPILPENGMITPVIIGDVHDCGMSVRSQMRGNTTHGQA